MVSRNLLSFMDEETLENRLAAAGKRKSWDDEFVLKRQFSALIPAFDPRPGRTNVNQTSDLEIPPPGSESESQVAGGGTSSLTQPSLSLVLKGPHLNGTQDVEISLKNPDWTIFRAVQELMQLSSLNKSDKMRKVWEPTFTIIYKEAGSSCGGSSKDDDGNNSEDGGKSTPVVSMLSGGSTLSPSSPMPTTPTASPSPPQCTVDDVLQLLSQLNAINMKPAAKASTVDLPVVDDDAAAVAADESNGGEFLTPDLFMSKKITNKLQQQIQDPLVLSSNSLPAWCEDLNQSCPFLFPFETRQLYFNCTAFGASRSIVWLQSQRDVTLERQRMPGLSPRRDDQHEFRVGRLKHERVKVPRNDNLLDWAMQVMHMHCNRKSVLEVEFVGEEGTGLGPTLEFYALVAAELQRADLAMWLFDDEQPDSTIDETATEIDLGEGAKPIGFYVRRSDGIFPAPLPQDSDICERVSKYYWFLGVFLAKVLQDGRLVDLPLSNSFLQLMCHNKILSSSRQIAAAAAATSSAKNSTDDVMISSVVSEESDRDIVDSFAAKVFAGGRSTGGGCCSSWYDGVLGMDNLHEIDPIRADFLRDLQECVQEKQNIENCREMTAIEIEQKVAAIRLKTKNGAEVAIDDLALTFAYLPSSKHYGYEAADLIPNGSTIDVTIENLEEYCELMTNFCLQDGIARQLEAFHKGFCLVFPLNKFAAFTPDEARMMICGEQHPKWTRDDLMNYTEPKLGYTKER